ncbi:MAG: hypothetical protein NT167_27295 [Verrucomicrobia bacterium]|nr:hypothetical protein [Verrucomicrobiota bacterium]
MSINQVLTVNLVLPKSGKGGGETVGFTRLLFGLTALALERLDAAQEIHCPDALRESAPPCPAGVPADPFDGQLWHFGQADTSFQLHGIGPNFTEAPREEGDLALAVVGSAQVSL